MSTEENLVHFGWYKDCTSQILNHFSCVLGGLCMSCVSAIKHNSWVFVTLAILELQFTSAFFPTVLNTSVFLKLLILFCFIVCSCKFQHFCRSHQQCCCWRHLCKCHPSGVAFAGSGLQFTDQALWGRPVIPNTIP